MRGRADTKVGSLTYGLALKSRRGKKRSGTDMRRGGGGGSTR